ncbi:MAG TPA: SAM-dependent methyltransferase [Actinomycetospora sp.]|uniref:class I SAM-dependent methyltransferase n=1 Tax=Actinomycetospora sp. TaxID=1872135 RepID=UPI002F3EC0A5
MSTESLGADHFDRLWHDEDDPWGLESSWYEDRKRAVVLAALPDPHYGRVFEPGCAGGALSVQLAARCDELVATDLADEAVERARTRVDDQPHVRVERAAVPHTMPDGPFDLVVVSELAYYFGAADRATLWDGVRERLAPGGTLLAVHWIREAPEYPVTGDEVHDELARLDGLARIAEHREADFRLDVLARVSSDGSRPPSVAQRVGLR